MYLHLPLVFLYAEYVKRRYRCPWKRMWATLHNVIVITQHWCKNECSDMLIKHNCNPYITPHFHVHVAGVLWQLSCKSWRIWLKVYSSDFIQIKGQDSVPDLPGTMTSYNKVSIVSCVQADMACLLRLSWILCTNRLLLSKLTWQAGKKPNNSVRAKTLLQWAIHHKVTTVWQKMQLLNTLRWKSTASLWSDTHHLFGNFLLDYMYH